MTRTSATPGPHVDGRVARARRTVDQVLTAFLEIIEDDGQLRPTADQVSRRAGVSRRALYLHFDSLEDVFTAAAERRTRRVTAAWEPPPPDLCLAERVDWFCDRWPPLLEEFMPLGRAATIHEPFCPQIGEALDQARRWGRRVAEQAFAPELDQRPAAEREALATALHHVTSWSAWSDLRSQGTAVASMRAAMHRMLTALLTPPPALPG